MAAIVRLTKLQIIEELTKIYIDDPAQRAINEFNGCQYLTGDGRLCIVGRCFMPGRISLTFVPPTYKRKIFTQGGSVTELWRDNHTTQEDFMKEWLDPKFLIKYRGHDLDFWSDLQMFHDGRDYWLPDNAGLSPEGEYKLEVLREKYKDK